ncbi:MAG: DUF2939 domain-containing protein [Rhodospirillaceae bacterium]|nr:MAG: DUF2939 domain-containing protein [Rhodospirillaceae bacterium]
MKNRGLLVAVALCTFLSAAYWYSPRYSLKQLQTSLATSDVIGLERYIDWPSVRDGLRTDLTAAFLEKTSARSDNNLSSAFAAALGPAVVTYVVDTFTSPQALIKLAEKQKAETAGPDSLTVASAEFTALDEFTIVFGKPVDQQTIRAVMQRDGFHWKITRISLPTNLLKDALTKNDGGSAKSANEATSADDAPSSGSLDLGHGSVPPDSASSADASLNAAAQAGAARLDAIDNEARMRAQAEADAATARAQIDAATAEAQAQALSNENALLRQQARDDELARARAEEAAYDAQQQRTVVFVQPRYGDRDNIIRGRDNDRKPNGIFKGPSIVNIERKNIETHNGMPQRQDVSTTPLVAPHNIGLQQQSPPPRPAASSETTTNSMQPVR